MSDLERVLRVFASQTDRQIREIDYLLEEEHEWVYTKKEAENLSSRIIGVFIASLCGETEIAFEGIENLTLKYEYVTSI